MVDTPHRYGRSKNGRSSQDMDRKQPRDLPRHHIFLLRCVIPVCPVAFQFVCPVLKAFGTSAACPFMLGDLQEGLDPCLGHSAHESAPFGSRFPRHPLAEFHSGAAFLKPPRQVPLLGVMPLQASKDALQWREGPQNSVLFQGFDHECR